MRRSPTPILALALALATSAPAADPLRTPDGWAVPEPGHHFSFPADHGSHPQFRIEWWYVTGHLATAPGRHYGFQATFFRAAGPKSADGDPAFGTSEVYLAHMALTDVAEGRFLDEERLNRAGWDAGASVGHLDLHNGEWSLRGADGTGPGIALHGGVRAEASFTLDLQPQKPLAIFGENGVSRKGAEASAASYYLTYSRLKATGTLSTGGDPEPVTGEAWMDHEISSSQLGSGQVGWDWVCIQFKDTNRELMLYRLRLADGTADPASRLQWVDPSGGTVTEPFTWEVLARWKSPRDGADYPARVRLGTVDPSTGKEVHFEIEPLVADQELANAPGGGPYWEGACRVRGESGFEAGSAYMELTGYANPLRF